MSHPSLLCNAPSPLLHWLASPKEKDVGWWGTAAPRQPTSFSLGEALQARERPFPHFGKMRDDSYHAEKERMIPMVVVDKKYGKYVHPEVERKFLLATIPPDTMFHADITDHYIPNTTLRLRRMQTEHEVTFKFAQKLRVHPHDTRVILHTNFYLSEAEYVFLASTLPSHRLEKRRFKFQGGMIPLAIDQFQGHLEGLVIAEVDFGPNGDPSSFATPSFALAEVTDDERFTGACLAVTTRPQLRVLLDEFNVK